MRRQRDEVQILLSSSSSDDDDDAVVVIKPRTQRNEPAHPAHMQRPPNPASLTEQQSKQKEYHQQQQKKNQTWMHRQPLVAAAKESLGWTASGRLPPHLSITDKVKGFEALMAARPETKGQVVILGKLLDTPRFQKAYLRDYNFTGMNHVCDAELPTDAVRELLDWANDQIKYWLPTSSIAHDNDDEGEIVTDRKDASTQKQRSENEWNFNSCLINWYLDGTHYIGPHADDERGLHPNSPIFVATLGQTRTFRIRRVVKKNEQQQHASGGGGASSSCTEPFSKDIEIRNNEFLVMGGSMQKHFKHEIVKVSGDKAKFLGPRISVTFRCFK